MNPPLRIAIFLGVFPVVSETFIIRQITGLLDLGHEVDIFADQPAEPGEPIHAEIAKYNLLARTTYMDAPPASGRWEMPVWPLTGRTWIPGEETSTRNIARFAGALPKLVCNLVAKPSLTWRTLRRSEYGFQAASLSAFYRLARLSSLPQKKYDLLHAHFGPVGNSFRFVRSLWRAPLMVSFHGYDVSTTPKKSGAAVYEKLFAEVDAVTANSDFMGAKLRSLGCPVKKIHKLRYGMDVSSFPINERNPGANQTVRVLSIARLTEKKGLEYAIRAVADVRQRHPEVSLAIVGEGPLRPRLEELIRELGQTGAIILHGAKDGATVRQMLSAAHIFILPSVTAENGDQEGTPVSILEAQAAGLPVIATHHAGIPEIVLDGLSGFLVPERDAAALAERLTYLAEHREMWPAMGRCGRTFVESNFSAAKCATDLLQIHEEARKNFSASASQRCMKRS